jgi:sugar-specific transcriptional regulator TrmB
VKLLHALDTENSIQTLTQLGLTPSQAKLYLNLLVLGKATAKAIAKLSNTDRSLTKRILTGLIDIGLVQRIVDSPVQFKPVPLDEVLCILLKRRKQEDLEIQKVTEELRANSSTKDYQEVFIRHQLRQ